MGRIPQMESVIDAILQPGQHAVIFGERGVGKTSLAHIIRPLIARAKKPHIVIKVSATEKDNFSSLWCKAFQEAEWKRTVESVGFKPVASQIPTNLRELTNLSDDASPDDIRRALTEAPPTVFVFDEFDRLGRDTRMFTDLIKMVSDFDVESTIVLVGVAQTVDQLIKGHASIARTLSQVPMPRMSQKELESILHNAAQQLQMQFDGSAAGRIAHMSQGLPHYTHLLGLHATRHACARSSKQIDNSDLKGGTLTALGKADATVRGGYSKAVDSAHADAKYRQVLLACALAKTNSVGFFRPTNVAEKLSNILNKKAGIASFARHISEFCQKKRGAILERHGVQFRPKYRFRDPLLPPYVIMQGVNDRLIEDDDP